MPLIFFLRAQASRAFRDASDQQSGARQEWRGRTRTGGAHAIVERAINANPNIKTGTPITIKKTQAPLRSERSSVDWILAYLHAEAASRNHRIMPTIRGHMLDYPLCSSIVDHPATLRQLTPLRLQL
jgi:hypothetical protein